MSRVLLQCGCGEVFKLGDLESISIDGETLHIKAIEDCDELGGTQREPEKLHIVCPLCGKE